MNNPQQPNRKNVILSIIVFFIIFLVFIGITYAITLLISPAESPTKSKSTTEVSSTSSTNSSNSNRNANSGANSQSSETLAYKLSEGNEKNELRYDQLLKIINGPEVKKIQSAEIGDATGSVELTLNDKSTLTSNYPPEELKLSDTLVQSGVHVEFKENRGVKEESSSWWNTLIILIVIFSFLFLFLFFVRRGQKQMMGMNQSKTTTVSKKHTGIYFKDVAGCDEAIGEVAECVDFLKNPARFTKLGAQMPAGIILHGPPGTGKTLIAKALASEAGVPFFSASGSEFIEMLVGVGAQRIRKLFESAREESGAVIFIDEIDAIGGKRNGAKVGNSNEEREQTLNQLLVELDGFNGREKIIVVAATNRLETLDPALLRPGRLSRKIPIPLPSEQGRLQILKVHCKNKPLAADVDLKALSKITYGSSGADLADMVNEAAILAARNQQSEITQANLSEGHLRALAGPEKAGATISKEEREIIAFHEAGHVLCAELSETHEKAQRATIKQRTSGAGGLALFGQNDRVLHSTRYFHEKMVCALGGRAAEKVVFGVVSSGAANDLQQANALARSAVQELGFSQRAGQLIHDQNSPLSLSDQTKTIADEEVERIVDEAFQEAVNLLEAHLVSLQNLAGALLEYEDINREIIEKTLQLDDTLEDWKKHKVSSGSFGVKTLKDKTTDAVSRALPSTDKEPKNNSLSKPTQGKENISQQKVQKKRRKRRFGLALPFQLELKLERKPKKTGSRNSSEQSE